MTYSLRISIEVKFRAAGVTVGNIRHSGILAIPNLAFEADGKFVRASRSLLDLRGVVVAVGLV
jgi:hypothetical protein